MLNKLTIKNLALIENIDIDFSKGLNVLSGETGSGKSVILESINFVLGGKADKSLIRSGTNECFVQAQFDISNNNNFDEVFSETDIEKDDLLIISRRLNIDGKNTVKINGNTVTVSMLKKFTSKLVDVHGQSEHFYLLSSQNQLKLLDKFCDSSILSIKDEIKENYLIYSKIKEQLESLGGDENQRLVRIDILKYQINEIEKAELKENEEENLLVIKEKLKNQEKIVTSLSMIKEAINSEGGISDILGNCVKTISSISNIDNQYNEIHERLNSVYSEIDDICSQTENLLDDFDYSEYDQNEIEIRLDLIKTLKKKYGNSFDEIMEFLSNAKTELNNLENFNENAEKLLIEQEKVSKTLYSLYIKLSDLRRNSALKLSDNIINELKELGMTKAQFYVDFAQKPDINDCKFNSSGFDSVCFMFSANNGESVKSLSEVISGGEMSRLMLAIKSQSSQYSDISTYIFDEIDAGISGVVAKTVAEKFAKIAKTVQVISVTHLPQISAMADNNLLIEKKENENTTRTFVKHLNNEDKIEEIIRLVGGEKNNEIAKEHAINIINQATNFKKTL